MDPIADTVGAPQTDEWETPRQLIMFATNMWGPFDVDGAATQRNSVAATYFGPDHLAIERRNALKSDDWFQQMGRSAWLNPPYSKIAGPLDEWVKKAIEQGQRGQEVVMLVKSDTSTQWFKRAWENSNSCVFLRPRVTHTLGGLTQGTPPWGSVLFRFTGVRTETRLIKEWK